MKIFVPSVDDLIYTNRLVCEEGGNMHQCVDRGKIESALHTAFYPGSYPFEAGGIVEVAAALCFYLVKSHPFLDGNKRTAALTAVVFLNCSGIELKYDNGTGKQKTAFAQVIESCAAGKVSKEKLMQWFKKHAVQKSVEKAQ